MHSAKYQFADSQMHTHALKCGSNTQDTIRQTLQFRISKQNLDHWFSKTTRVHTAFALTKQKKQNKAVYSIMPFPFRLFQTQILLCLISTICPATLGFYVPGVAPVEFTKGQIIDVKAVKMTSTRTQLPYEYYSLQFCLPKNGTLSYKSENLGEVLRGDRIVNTPYEVRMAENINCKLLCNKKDQPLTWDPNESNKVIERIRHEYFVHLYVSVAIAIVSNSVSALMCCYFGFQIG